MMNIINHSYHLLIELMPVFLLAIIASSLLDYYLPDSYIKKISNIQNKNLGIYIAAFIGSLIPICTCGMIPLTIKLHEKGLDWRYLCSFLVAGNACSITALILTSAISFELTMIRFFASIVFGIFVTNILILLSKIKKNFQLELLVHHDHCCEHNTKPKLLNKIACDLIDLSKTFVPWILLAVFFASLLHESLQINEDQIAVWLLKSKEISPFIASVVAFPFYFCAGADVPISAELIKQGVAIGTVISFMLASPGVNLTSLLVYKQAIGLPKAVLLSSVSILVAFLIGFIINLSL